MRSSRYMRTVSKTKARCDGPVDVALTEPAGPKPLPFSSRQAPTLRKQPARKSCGNTCTRIGRASNCRATELLNATNKKVRQAGTITNNMVIHIRFYGLVPVVATPIYPASKAQVAIQVTRLRIRGCIWDEYGDASGQLKSCLTMTGYESLTTLDQTVPDCPLTTKPTGHHAIQILPAMPC